MDAAESDADCDCDCDCELLEDVVVALEAEVVGFALTCRGLIGLFNACEHRTHLDALVVCADDLLCVAELLVAVSSDVSEAEWSEGKSVGIKPGKGKSMPAAAPARLAPPPLRARTGSERRNNGLVQ